MSGEIDYLVKATDIATAQADPVISKYYVRQDDSSLPLWCPPLSQSRAQQNSVNW